MLIIIIILKRGLMMNPKTYIEEHFEECKQLLKKLVQIPAPSYHEEQRALFIKQWLHEVGYQEEVIVDEHYNVIVECSKSTDSISLVMAHIDTVFNDLQTIEFREEDSYLHAPGIGDDGANVVLGLMLLKYCKEMHIDLNPYVFVFNVCEEGLGNLAGSKAIYERYQGRIIDMVSFDCYYDEIFNQAVGSIRYKITVNTKGGHSYFDFPEKNAIVEACSLIEGLYHLDYQPQERTTYNVGTIQGGTSVNTIAQEAHFLFEIRSVNAQDLHSMQQLAEVLLNTQKEGVTCSYEIIGVRPCDDDLEKEVIDQMTKQAQQAIQSFYKGPLTITSGSTDCNWFLSKGIPSICFGLCLGDGAHTLEEKIQTESLKNGFQIAFRYLFTK